MILVTGGCGFIGSEFVRQSYKDLIVVDKLTYAGSVNRLGNQKVTFYKYDIADDILISRLFEAYPFEAIVNFASETHVDRAILNDYAFIHTNVLGTRNLAKLALLYQIPLIHISTDEVYGASESGYFKETDPMLPKNPYSATKAAAEHIINSYINTYGLKAIIVRPTNNYGYWQYEEKFMPTIIKNALQNKPIPVYGQGQQVREWLHVSDCATAIHMILNSGRYGEVYNVGSGFELKNIETVKMVLHAMEKPEVLIRFIEDRPGHDFRYSIDSTKIKNELGWIPMVDFKEGILDTIEFYKNHLTL